MFYSNRKRRMFSRSTIFILICLSTLLIFYQSHSVRQTACSLPTLRYGCFKIEAESWNLFYHLGGNGPWIPRASDDTPGQLPRGCEVEQVHMITRHAERYPTKNAGARHVALLHKLKSETSHLSGSLEFLNTWTYFANISNSDFENITRVGPYAGTLQAFNTGITLRKRYNTIVDFNRTTILWSCSTQRDIDTAKHFADGFFGSDWERSASANLVIIPESPERGADTLTPGDTCLRYIKDKVNGHDRGYSELAEWQRIFTEPIARRLAADVGGISLEPLEIYSMMEMCGFEILARGSSPWCNVFSHEEWLDFEYGRDLLHFYRAGPGNDYAGALGWLWLNATTTLISDETTSGVYFSFVHDGDIIPLLATLGILDEAKNPGYLPNNKRLVQRRWKTSDVTPMGGRLIFEKIVCKNTGLGQNLRRSYVRLYINDGIIDLEKSLVGGGLANAVGLVQWVKMVRQKGSIFGEFKDVCGLEDDAPSKITFLQPQYQ